MVSSFNGFTPKKYIRHLNSIPTGSMSVTFSRRKPFNLILMESFAEFFREFFKNTFCVVMWVCAEIYFIAYRISIVWIVKHFYIVQCMNNKYNNAVLIIIIDRKDFFLNDQFALMTAYRLTLCIVGFSYKIDQWIISDYAMVWWPDDGRFALRMLMMMMAMPMCAWECVYMISFFFIFHTVCHSFAWNVYKHFFCALSSVQLYKSCCERN